jgi:hypothetical protein
MTECARAAVIPLLVILLAATGALGQDYGQPPTPSSGQDYLQTSPAASFSQQELDQMLAPIALYPDSLLSQILMASTYPLEVVEAARWSSANPGLQGDQAVRSAEQFDWDASVKSLTAFPQILSMMDARLDWTRKLGDAFLAQQGQVMDTVQNLRRRAYDAGNLRSTEQIGVQADGSAIDIGFANPELTYLPYYDPLVVYGTWWWPAYPPVYWAPWPGYALGQLRGFYWGPAIAVPFGFFFGAIDWRRHLVNVVGNDYYNRVFARHRRDVPRPGGVTSWQHEPAHRQNVPYRSPAVRQQFGRETRPPESRQQFRGYEPPPTAIGTPANRPALNRESVPPPAPRPAPRPAIEQRPNVFEAVPQGSQARDFSARGRASYERVAPSSAPAMRAPASAPAPSAAPRPAGGGRVRR